MARKRGRGRGRNGKYAPVPFVPPQAANLLQWFDGQRTDHPSDPLLKTLIDLSVNGLDGEYRIADGFYNLNPTADATLAAAGITNSWLTRAQIDALYNDTTFLTPVPTSSKLPDTDIVRTLVYTTVTVLLEFETTKNNRYTGRGLTVTQLGINITHEGEVVTYA
jgi:hypothetical protein